MSTLKEIKSAFILQKAMFIVNLAKREILATMNLAEEIKTPLPLEYFFLLEKKIKEGVKITRLAFGEPSELKIFNKKHKIKSKNYRCFLSTTKNYKRMLMVDGKHLLFAIGVQNKRKFFYTKNPQIIKKFSNYFSQELKIAKD